MNITLYNAADTVRNLLEQIDPETGELPPELEQARAIVATKAQAVTAFILSNDHEADYVEQHAKSLLDRVKAARRRSTWLKQYLGSHMAACGLQEIKADDGTFHAKLERERDELVDVWDVQQVPQDYMREIPAKFEPDKTLIKKAIKDGFEVAGAKIVRKDRLTLK